MRFKPRAWDKVDLKFREVVGLSFYHDAISVKLNDEEYLQDDIDRFELTYPTGLTDKNGREIYEGDIVKSWNRGIVGTFQVKWRSEGVPMYILFPAWQKGEFWNLYNNGSGVDKGIEVIGNIYQNEELWRA